MSLEHILEKRRRTSPFCGALMAGLMACLLAAGASAETAASGFCFPAAYVKQEYRIPMRDGVRLFTAVYSPRDSSRLHPVLLTRTPYGAGPYGETNFMSPSDSMLGCAKEGFILVFQDVRGRKQSEGQFEHVRPVRRFHSAARDTDETTDAYDTIDWLLKNMPANNGRVGLTGVSYPGFYAAEGLINSHPALKCVLPQAPVGDWFLGDDYRENGVLCLEHAAKFAPALEPAPASGAIPSRVFQTNSYQFFLNLGPLSSLEAQCFPGRGGFWREITNHGAYDRFWQERALASHLGNVHVPVLAVGGWNDVEDLYGTLSVYHAVQRQSSVPFAGLVMGPWEHGAWTRSRRDASSVSVAAGQYYRERIELPFLRRFLEGDAGAGLSPVTVFETGGSRWDTFSSWPPREAEAVRYFFRSGGVLSSAAPDSREKQAFDAYISDPACPVPQQAQAGRPDVLVYETSPMPEDMTVAGPIEAHLEVSTTGTDSDWVVMVLDAPPVEQGGGPAEASLVRGGILRGKFRESFERPRPFKPGKVTIVQWSLNDICHTFRQGHCLRVEVRSSWFPFFDRNPQKFCDIAQAGPGDFQKATQRLYHSPRNSSWLTIPRLNRPAESGMAGGR